ncbi:MAG: outer membrane beta-barrel protein [Gemmatimonadetes bacterium]|nr:outer membrane beta-barrel protein [Gemmatimonadota bacterium]
MMKPMLRSLLLGAAFVGVVAAPAAAQSGFALKGSYIYNHATVEDARETREVPAASGFGMGAEFVLPMGFGLGVSGYTGGTLSEFDRDASRFTVLAEANYFLRLPLLPLAPYAGVHAGLGRYSGADVENPSVDVRDDNLRQLGYQLGLRFQLTSLLGLDVQYRRVSTSLQADQDIDFSRDQVLLGITLF